VVLVVVAVVLVVAVLVAVVSARLACLNFISCVFPNDHAKLHYTKTHFSSHRINP
jgi:hypothetical protein